ncbi:amino acid transporter [Vararia minispora EC-137]|uniref:Amino acid transporter n=1 Tax=Vararia minispora EC-137 TaxID=1314806 RepID=A0ACB8QZV2_9AGAM|nr:amino acid transporter [Vararia minispora EC-137]
MLGRSSRSPANSEPSEAQQPLLGSSHDALHDDSVLFSVADDDSDGSEERSVLSHPDGGGRPEERSVHFRETTDVRIYAPEWSQASREAEFDGDSDNLDADAVAQLESQPAPAPSRRSRRDQTAPLLVGLLDASNIRRGADNPYNMDSITPANGNMNLEELARKQNAGGGMLQSIANMANSILGAGIIGLPYAVSRAGFVMGVSLLVILCAVTDWTIRLIVLNAKLAGSNSYIDVMNRCFGQSGRAAVSFFQFAFAFGGMCAFGIIIGDTIPHVIRSIFPGIPSTPVVSLLANRQFVIALCTICVSYPLSLYRDIHKLSFASGLALVGMLIIVVSVIFEGPQVPAELKGDPAKRFSLVEPGIFQAIGVISFAYVCHHNSLLIYGSLRTPTLDRFAKVTHASTAISLVACVTMAVAGYEVFTDKTQGNILNNFPLTDPLINVARFCFGLNMFTTLPLELFVCREVIEQYFFSHEPFHMTRHVFFTTTILFASMILALITCDLGVMLEITGGVSATALAYIFPAVCYIHLLSTQAGDEGKYHWYSRKLLPAYACASFGAIVMALSLFLALGKVWSRDEAAKICM